MRKRDYKNFAPGEYYHVYNRGNGKMDIFRDEQDYRNFLKRLRMVLGKEERVPLSNSNLSLQPLPGAFSLLMYCLMPNHFHLAVRQETDVPISKLILKVCTSYSMYFNRKYDHVGHVFQDQFKAVPVESDRQLLWLSFYIHNNPKKDDLVERADEWPYSSYREYLGQIDMCDTTLIPGEYADAITYRTLFEDTEAQKGAPFQFEL